MASPRLHLGVYPHQAPSPVEEGHKVEGILATVPDPHARLRDGRRRSGDFVATPFRGGNPPGQPRRLGYRQQGQTEDLRGEQVLADRSSQHQTLTICSWAILLVLQ